MNHQSCVNILSWKLNNSYKLHLHFYFGTSTTWDRSTTHLKFDPTGVRTNDHQIMTVHFMSLRRLLWPLGHQWLHTSSKKYASWSPTSNCTIHFPPRHMVCLYTTISLGTFQLLHKCSSHIYHNSGCISLLLPRLPKVPGPFEWHWPDNLSSNKEILTE